MIVGKENILKFIRDSKTPYWKIRRAGTTEIIAESDDSSSLSVEDSLIRFQNYLDLLSSGNYSLETWETAGQKKERLKVAFQLTGNAPAMSGANPPVNFPTVPAIDVQAEIQRALAEERQKNRIETLEKEKAALEAKCRELQNIIDSSETRIKNRLEPFIPQLMGVIFPDVQLAQSQIGTANNKNLDDEQVRLENAFEKWQKYESDPITMVEKIAKLSETDAGTYQMARGILMSK